MSVIWLSIFWSVSHLIFYLSCLSIWLHACVWMSVSCLSVYLSAFLCVCLICTWLSSSILINVAVCKSICLSVSLPISPECLFTFCLGAENIRAQGWWGAVILPHLVWAPHLTHLILASNPYETPHIKNVNAPPNLIQKSYPNCLNTCKKRVPHLWITYLFKSDDSPEIEVGR